MFEIKVFLYIWELKNIQVYKCLFLFFIDLITSKGNLSTTKKNYNVIFIILVLALYFFGDIKSFSIFSF